MQEDLLLHLPLRVRHFRRCPFWSGHEGVFSPVDEIQVVLEDLAVLHSQIVCGLFLVMGEWNRQLRQVVVLGAVNQARVSLGHAVPSSRTLQADWECSIILGYITWRSYACICMYIIHTLDRHLYMNDKHCIN